MLNVDLKNLWVNITCILPVYDEQGGNSTEVRLLGGESIIISKKTNTVIKKLAEVFAVDVFQLKKKYGVLIGRKTSTPLPFHPELLLLPVKYRHPFAKDEGSRGYIVKKFINKIRPAEDKTKTRIELLDGTYIFALQSFSSLNLVIAHAEVIEREIQSSLHIVKENEELYRVIRAVLNQLESIGENETLSRRRKMFKIE